MFDYMKIQHCDNFFTVAEACEHLGLTKDELHSKCDQYGVELFKIDGQWGFLGEDFRRFNNTLYFEQCRDGSDDSRIWTDASTIQTAQEQENVIRRDCTMRSYIKNIKDLKSIYTYDETCQLLGVSEEELNRVCDQYDIRTFADYEGTPIFTCYEFLTLNNKLYREQCEASGKESSCA